MPREQITLTVDTGLEAAIRACEISLAQECFLDFVQYIFKSEGKTFIVGRHTKEICAKIDVALKLLFEDGISSYLLLTVPFRHGKSELVSRLLIPYIIGKYHQNTQNIELEFILGSYTASLSDEMSKDIKRYMLSSGYKDCFPDIFISKTSSANTEWAANYLDPESGLDKQVCKFHSAGLLGGVTGKGASVMIMDDILKNRAEAESQTYRNRQWVGYTDDFMTRLAPKFLHILCATRWHVDDVLGRVLERNNPESPKYDPLFPKYDVLHYRAKEDDGSYLFPERFDAKWYERQFATLGPYSAPALLQGDPIAKGGNMLPADKIQLRDTIPFDLLERVLPVRFWDLASSEKEVAKDNPDATVGCRGFVWFNNARASDDESELEPYFFVTDVRSCKLLATARNSIIIEAARSDGHKVWQGIESVGGYKDAATTLKTLLKGVSIVHPISVHKDKFTRASEVLPLMDAERVYFVRGWWNTDMMTEIAQFPSGAHDDYVDALSGCYAMAYARALKMLQSGYLGGAGFSAGRHVMQLHNYDEDLGAPSDELTSAKDDLKDFLGL